MCFSISTVTHAPQSQHDIELEEEEKAEERRSLVDMKMQRLADSGIKTGE